MWDCSQAWNWIKKSYEAPFSLWQRMPKARTHGRETGSEPPRRPRRALWNYFLVGTAFWAIVDFTTAFNPDVGGWVHHMPTVWIYYLGAPLLFAYLIYVRGWSDRELFVPVLVVMFVVEVFFSGNVLLLTFPILLVMIPVAVAIYSFLTYVPRWVVDGRLGERRTAVLSLALVWVAVAVLSYATRAG